MKSVRRTRREMLQGAGVSLSVWAASTLGAFGDGAAAVRPFAFVQITDTQLGMGGYEHDVRAFEVAVQQVNKLNPDFVVICGDLVNRADAKSFADFNRIKATFSIPCHCTPGNHDVGNQPTPESLRDYRKIVGRDYYAFQHKGISLVVVNSQLWKTPLAGETEPHDAWLQRTLKNAARENRPIVIVGHHPLFVKAPDEAEGYFSLPPDRRNKLLGLFTRSGVRAVLTGHTHRTVIHQHGAMQLVSCETTSKNFDGRPLGFRLWKVDASGAVTHEFHQLEM